MERGFSADGAGTVLTDGAGPARAQRVPRGFRVALQGAEGIVSLEPWTWRVHVWRPVATWSRRWKKVPDQKPPEEVFWVWLASAIKQQAWVKESGLISLFVRYTIDHAGHHSQYQ